MTLTNKAFKKLLNTSIRAGTPTEPRCPHASDCGGCAFQDRAYAEQVTAKAAILRQIWQDEDILPPDVLAAMDCVPSPNPYEYRTRMDYVATKGRFGLRRSGRFNYIVELETCHLIPPAAFHAAYTIWLAARDMDLPDYNIRTHEGFLRYIVVRRSPQNTLLLAAVTADGDYAPQMARLADLALTQSGVVGFHWLSNTGMSDVSFGTSVQHWGVATLPMQVGDWTLHIGPNTFFQNNVHLLLPLLDHVRAAVNHAGTHRPQRVADLYSGAGSIALHLAQHVEQIIAVESQVESAHLARYNISVNGITNATSQADDVYAFLRGQLRGSFDCIVADPPRTGLGAAVCTELLRLLPRRIVYVSCNPLTQRDDIRQLAAAYRVTSLRGYDMFPHTPHVESLAVLDAA